MRLVQFVVGQNGSAAEPHVGVLVDGGKAVLDVTAALAARGLTSPPTSTAWLDVEGPLWPAVRAVVDELEKGGEAKRAEARKAERLHDVSAVRLTAPVPRPGKVMCIGLNYRDHAIESNMPIPESPIMFAKFASSVIGPGDAVVIPNGCTQPDYEAELAVVIGKRAKAVTKANAMEHVLGYACFNDVSARDFQFLDKQWTRGKACDTFAPIGPCVVTRDEVANPEDLAIRFRLNGQLLQDSRTNQLIFGIAALIEFLSGAITLEPGDVIATGTPPGVGFARKPPVYIKPGDRMEVEIEGLGVLENPVK
jgi:2-keto-4-pentenoate hydratase/2-oxohepta-3-ene-1,7-dioic acid hydratase in catechol pathway